MSCVPEQEQAGATLLWLMWFHAFCGSQQPFASGTASHPAEQRTAAHRARRRRLDLAAREKPYSTCRRATKGDDLEIRRSGSVCFNGLRLGLSLVAWQPTDKFGW